MRAALDARGVWRSRPEAITTLPALVNLPDTLQAAEGENRRRVEAVLGQNDRLLPALVNLKRMGPHFAVAGPPLSGKTTTVYNWVLTLAERYPPSRVNFVLIDYPAPYLRLRRRAHVRGAAARSGRGLGA